MLTDINSAFHELNFHFKTGDETFFFSLEKKH